MNHFGTDVEDYPDHDIYADVDDYEEPDHRWRPVAAIAAGVLVLAVIATALIVHGGDSASTTATVGPPPTRPVIATPRYPLSKAPNTSPPPETVTTVTPPPTAPPTPAPSGQPTTTAPEAMPSTPPAVNPRTIVYRVTGTKQLFDFVSIVYTDARGLPHTDFNVSLPWSKTIVLNPGVQLKSVVATSFGGHLNCVITDAQGQTLVVSSNNTMIATCTR